MSRSLTPSPLPSPSLPHRNAFGCALAATLVLAASLPAARAADCVAQARAGERVPAVVELYTSEGCSSCPPADRWVSGLAGHDGVVALAFHVDYWDSAEWRDRFAQAQFTQRQDASRRKSGARFAYTPQVIVDGRDMPQWAALPPSALAARAPSAVGLQLARDGTALALTVTPGPGAPARLDGFVAVVDDGMLSRVGGGENRGATLHEDAVVRELLPWSTSGTEARTLRFTPDSTPEPGARRHWVAVVTDPASARPLQALSLACPR